MPLHIPDHLIEQAAESASGDVVAASRRGAEIALSIVAKWLAATNPDTHQAFIQEFQ